MRVAALSLALLTAGSAAAAKERARRIFYVAADPPALMELHVASRASVRVTALPAAAAAEPEGLRVSADGRAAFLAPFHGDPLESRKPPVLWIWNGHEVRAVPMPGVPDRNRVWLDARVPRLYWTENVHVHQERDALPGEEYEVQEVRTTFRIHAMGLDGKGHEVVFTHEFPTCVCGTGACDETCPVGVVVQPGDEIAHTILVNHWIAGQLGDTTESSWLLSRRGAGFVARRLPQDLDVVLDASPDAGVLVAAVPDDGCCAQLNAGNDRTLLITTEGTTVVFDERAQIGNEVYNVSVSTLDAALSPDLDAVAMTLAMYPAEPESWGPYEGNDDPEERARLAAIRTRLPVVQVAGKKGIDARKEIDGAGLVGWLDGGRLVLHRGGRLLLHHLGTGEEDVLPPEVRSARHAFVR